MVGTDAAVIAGAAKLRLKVNKYLNLKCVRGLNSLKIKFRKRFNLVKALKQCVPERFKGLWQTEDKNCS